MRAVWLELNYLWMTKGSGLDAKRGVNMLINDERNHTHARLDRAVGRLEGKVSALIALAIATFVGVVAMLASQIFG